MKSQKKVQWFRYPAEVLMYDDLGSSAKLIYCFMLWRFMFFKRVLQQPYCESQDNLAKQVGVSRKTVNESVIELEKIGWLSVEKFKIAAHVSINIYTVKDVFGAYPSEISEDVCNQEQFNQGEDKAEGNKIFKLTEDFVKSKEFLLTQEWKELRQKVFLKQGNFCCCCGATSNLNGAYLCIDHIKPRKTHPHLALDIDNLQVLCNSCNEGKLNWHDHDWRVK